MRKGILLTLFSVALSAQIAFVQWDDKGVYKKIREAFESNLPWGVDKYNVYGDKSKISGVMERLKTREYKIVVVTGDDLLKAAVVYLPNTPVVFLGCRETKPAEGKKNITGITLDPTPEEVVKTVLEILPNIKKVGLIFKTPGQYVKVYSSILEKRGIKVERVMAQNPGGVNTALRFMTDVDLFWMVPDELNRKNATFKFLLISSQKKMIPIMGLDENYVKAGALFAITPDLNFIGRKGAGYVKSIVDGIPPENLPILHPRASYVINLKVAKKLNLNISPLVINNARNVIR